MGVLVLSHMKTCARRLPPSRRSLDASAITAIRTARPWCEERTSWSRSPAHASLCSSATGGPGTHANAVGASTPAWRQLGVDTVAAAASFTDSRESLRNEAGEYRLALEQGAISGEDHVRAELGEVLGDDPDRDAQLEQDESVAITGSRSILRRSWG